MISPRLTTSCVLLTCVVAVGCGGAKPATSNRTTADVHAPDITSMAPTAPSGSAVTTKQVVDDVKAGTETMEQKYKDKTIELVGTVSKFSTQTVFDNNIDVVLFWEKSGDYGIGIECEMAEPEPWKTISPGQAVRIKGVAKPKLNKFGEYESYTYLTMEKCTIVEAKPLTAPLTTFDVKDLVAEFAKDPDSLGTKFGDKPFIVTGKLKVIGLTENAADLTLEAPEDVIVRCVFSLSDPY